MQQKLPGFVIRAASERQVSAMQLLFSVQRLHDESDWAQAKYGYSPVKPYFIFSLPDRLNYTKKAVPMM